MNNKKELEKHAFDITADVCGLSYARRWDFNIMSEERLKGHIDMIESYAKLVKDSGVDIKK